MGSCVSIEVNAQYNLLQSNELKTNVSTNPIFEFKTRLQAIETSSSKPKEKARAYINVIKELRAIPRTSVNDASIKALIGDSLYKLGRIYFRYSTLNRAMRALTQAVSYGNSSAEQMLKLINGVIFSDVKTTTQHLSTNPQNNQPLIFTNIYVASESHLLNGETTNQTVLNALPRSSSSYMSGA